MIDKEIIKALECCSTATCISNNCPYEKIHDIPTCTTKLTRDALDLINRQKAEIERLKDNGKLESENIMLNSLIEMKNDTISNQMKAFDMLESQFKTAKSEAYKEFAELSIKRICEEVSAPIPSESYIVEKCNQTIDNLLKEMEGDNE